MVSLRFALNQTARTLIGAQQRPIVYSLVDNIPSTCLFRVALSMGFPVFSNPFFIASLPITNAISRWFWVRPFPFSVVGIALEARPFPQRVAIKSCLIFAHRDLSSFSADCRRLLPKIPPEGRSITFAFPRQSPW
jgi:hypothetical protein